MTNMTLTHFPKQTKQLAALTELTSVGPSTQKKAD